LGSYHLHPLTLLRCPSDFRGPGIGFKYSASCVRTPPPPPRVLFTTVSRFFTADFLETTFSSPLRWLGNTPVALPAIPPLQCCASQTSFFFYGTVVFFAFFFPVHSLPNSCSCGPLPPFVSFFFFPVSSPFLFCLCVTNSNAAFRDPLLGCRFCFAPSLCIKPASGLTWFPCRSNSRPHWPTSSLFVPLVFCLCASRPPHASRFWFPGL